MTITWKQINRTVEVTIKVQGIPAHAWHFDRGIVVTEDDLGLGVSRVEHADDDFIPEDVMAEIMAEHPGTVVVPYAWYYDNHRIEFGVELKVVDA